LCNQRINRKGRFASGMVANNEFALSPAERKERVHRDDPGVHGFGYNISLDNRWCRTFDRQSCLGVYCPFSIERATQRIYDSPKQGFPHRYANNITGAEYGVASLNSRCAV
jgi:hypothetical protein